GLMDLRNTPVQETFAGVEIHANVMHSILNNQFIRLSETHANFWAIVVIAVLVGALVSLIISRPLISLAIPVLAVLLWIVFAYNQFLSKLVMWEIVRPVLALTGTYLGVFLYNFLVAEKDKRYLKATFGTYISPDLIEEMYRTKQEPKLGGEQGYHSAFFSDIQSFSSFSEVLEPERMVALMNEYLTAMTEVLLKNQGTLDKYIGDAIVAFFGAPMPVEEHEYLVCMTALEMSDRLAELRLKWQSEPEWPAIVHHMLHRVGLNSGKMVTGNMGSTMRMNYTMMGDTVNLAARLEASAKQYGVYIQVADATYQAVKDRFIWRELDYVRVMGKTEPVRVHELICEPSRLTPQAEKLLQAYNQALNLYKNQQWEQAIAAFQSADQLEDMFPGRKTNPSRIYIPRCEYWQANPPGADWNGVWTLTSK
ncbi:MAG: adenylate/guanylate cyclase domain-containing protein, partial [Candidatus Neomarinimicrobiota bacterium]